MSSLLVFSSLVALLAADCQDGYTYSTYTNKCYKFVAHRNANFMAAQSLCQVEGGNLASVHDQAENSFIRNALGIYSVWYFIGINILSRPQTWTDGSPINYTNWSHGEPSSAPCAVFDSLYGFWGTYDCNLPLPYICKTSPSPAHNCPTTATCPLCPTTPPSSPRPCPTVVTSPPPACPSPPAQSCPTIATCPPPPAPVICPRCPTIPPPPPPCPTVPTHPPSTCPPPVVCPTTKPPVVCPATTTRPPPTCPPPKAPCETDWTYLASTKSCYFTYWGASWSAAENNCKSRGAHLASIHSDEENNLVYLLGKSGYGGNYQNNIWIGLYKSGGKWIWSDGTPVNYSRWSPGEPNNKDGNEGCVQLYTDPVSNCRDCGASKWNDYKCGYSLRAFVCKKRALV